MVGKNIVNCLFYIAQLSVRQCAQKSNYFCLVTHVFYNNYIFDDIHFCNCEDNDFCL